MHPVRPKNQDKPPVSVVNSSLGIHSPASQGILIDRITSQTCPSRPACCRFPFVALSGVASCYRLPLTQQLRRLGRSASGSLRSRYRGSPDLTWFVRLQAYCLMALAVQSSTPSLCLSCPWRTPGLAEIAALVGPLLDSRPSLLPFVGWRLCGTVDCC